MSDLTDICDDCGREHHLCSCAVDEFNEGHIVEGLDRTNILLNMVDDLLQRHPAIIKAGVQDDIDQVQGILAQVYQRVGELDKG